MENIFILLYVKMVNGVSEGTGENEFRELDHKERMRREAKKILKGKIYTRGYFWSWPICTRLQEKAQSDRIKAVNGLGWSSRLRNLWVLSIIGWLRRYIIEGFLGTSWYYFKEVMKAMLRK